MPSNSSTQIIRLRKNPNCKVCGPNPEITQLIDYDAYCGVPTRDQPENHHTPYDLVPAEVASKIKQGESIKFVDVREPVELQISQIPGAINIPVGELAQRLEELDRNQEYILVCRTGVRSARALGILHSAGYAKSFNLRGGINAWARDVDPKLPVY